MPSNNTISGSEGFFHISRQKRYNHHQLHKHIEVKKGYQNGDHLEKPHRPFN